MGVVRMGIVGGCLSHQPGIPIKQLYHQQLAGMLTDRGITLRTLLDRSFDARYSERLADLTDRGIDLALLHVRPMAVLENSRILVRKEQADGNAFRINGRLWGGAFADPSMRSSHSPSAQRFAKRDGNLRSAQMFEQNPGCLGRVNLLLGFLLGLHKRVVAETLSAIENAADLAARNDIPLLVMGPTPYAGGTVGRWLCMQMNDALRQRSSGRFTFVDVFTGWQLEYLFPDGLHVTQDGHAHVADRLHSAIEQILEQTTLKQDTPTAGVNA